MFLVSKKNVFIGAAVLVMLFCWTIFIIFKISYQTKEQELIVSMLDVGQGDAFLIETPKKYRILIDGGPDTNTLNKIDERIPFFDRKIHTVVASHLDSDHITGLVHLYERYGVEHTLLASSSKKIKQNPLIDALFAKANISSHITSIKRGDRLYLDQSSDLYLEVLHPAGDFVHDDTNEHSAVLKLHHREVCILFMGDAGVEIENMLIKEYKQDLECQVLKVGHHGSDTSTSLVFLGEVKPNIALISVGKENKFGHPHQSVLDNIEKVDAKIYRTDELGTVIVKSDGKEVWVE